MCYEFTVNFQILKTISCILLLLQDFAYPFHRIVLSFAKNVYLCRIKSKVCGMSYLVNHNCPQSHCKCPKNLRPPRHVHLKLLYLKAWRNKSNAGNLFGYKFLTGVKLSFGLFLTLALAYPCRTISRCRSVMSEPQGLPFTSSQPASSSISPKCSLTKTSLLVLPCLRRGGFVTGRIFSTSSCSIG